MSLDSPQACEINGAAFRIGIVAACFNKDCVDGLLARVESRLRRAGVEASNLDVIRVPGSHEIPWAAQTLAMSGPFGGLRAGVAGKPRAAGFDTVIALGVLIGGDTRHHEMVGQSVSYALQQVALQTHVPVINGVIVVDSPAQARARCLGRINRGAEFAEAALAMAALCRRVGR